MAANIEPKIAAAAAELTAIRRDIHAHPELGFEEERTSRIVAEKLKEWGVEVTTGIGKTGVVGTIRVGNNPKAIGLRADMDALPMDEHNTFDHRSPHKGRMHACGHDGHTTMLLGAAKYLSATRNFDGTVHFIFQPAEEGRGGAEAMVKDGLFEKFPCEQIFGMHNRPKLDVGKFAIRPGPQMAGGGLFDIHITGKGAHGARPETGIDPVIIAHPDHLGAAERGVAQRGAARFGGDLGHPDACRRRLQRHPQRGGAARHHPRLPQGDDGADQGAHRDDLRPASRRPWAARPSPTCASPSRRWSTTRLGAVHRRRRRDDRRQAEHEPRGAYVMASEDFSYMLEKVPGAFINIGNGGGEGGCEVHNPGYDFNDEIITLGATLWSRVVETKLAKNNR